VTFLPYCAKMPGTRTRNKPEHNFGQLESSRSLVRRYDFIWLKQQ